MFQQLGNITQGSILRAVGQFGPFRTGQLAFKTIQQAIQQHDLTLVETTRFALFPKPGSNQYLSQSYFSLL